MSESLEHKWLSNTFLEIIESFSHLDLYTYSETERRKLDFSCMLKRDLEKALVGQTLWKHDSGIDKDLRTLITASDSDIWAYIARDNSRNRAQFYEIIQDFRESKYKDDLFRLKIFWIQENFEAGNIESEKVVKFFLREQIVNDILLNIVFGKIHPEDIRFFLEYTGLPGLHFAILAEIARNGYRGDSDLGRRIGIPKSTLRPYYLKILGSGFIYEPDDYQKAGARALVSLKGRVFLKLAERISEEHLRANISSELAFIIQKLGLEPSYDEPIDNFSSLESSELYNPPKSDKKYYRILRSEIAEASRAFGTQLSNIQFLVSEVESSKYNIIR